MNAKVDLTNVVLETERLLLRAWNENDLDDLYENASIDQFGELAGWKHHENKAESKQVLDKFINDKNAFAVVYKGNSKIIANIILDECQNELDESFKNLKGRKIRFVLNQKYWGRSLMSESMQCVIEYCFHELEFDYLCSGYFIDNDMQRSFNEKMGFKDYKRFYFHTNYGVDRKMELTFMYNPKKQF